MNLRLHIENALLVQEIPIVPEGKLCVYLKLVLISSNIGADQPLFIGGRRGAHSLIGGRIEDDVTQPVYERGAPLLLQKGGAPLLLQKGGGGVPLLLQKGGAYERGVEIDYV